MKTNLNVLWTIFTTYKAKKAKDLNSLSKDALNCLSYQKMTLEELKAGEMTVTAAMMAIVLAIPSATIVMVSKQTEVAVAEVEGASMVVAVEVVEEE